MEEKNIYEGRAIILMTTYNGERFLEKQLNSIIDQSFRNWRLIVSDDGSSDGTLSILYKYRDKEKRILEIIENEGVRRGAYGNYCQLIEYIKKNYDIFFDYFFYCDQDDIWLSEKMEVEIDELNRSRGGGNVPVLCFSDVIIIDHKGNSQGKRMSDHTDLTVRSSRDFLFEYRVILGTSMAHNKVLWDMIRTPIEFKKDIIAHDQLIRKYAAVYGVIRYISTPLVLYRRHNDNSSGMISAHTIRNDIRKLITGFTGSVDYCARQNCAIIDFVDHCSERDDYLLEIRDALVKGGIKCMQVLKRNQIRISETFSVRVAVYYILLTGCYKKRPIYKRFIRSRLSCN